MASTQFIAMIKLLPWFAMINCLSNQTKAGGEFNGNVVEGNPYPGAKPYFLISGELWDNHEWLSQLINITAYELPLPKKIPFRKNAK